MAEQPREQPNEPELAIHDARRAIREFAAKEKRGEITSGHFLPYGDMTERFNDQDIPDDEILLFPKALDGTLTDEEFRAYREKLTDDQGVKKGVDPFRRALLQYINNRMGVIRMRHELEKLKEQNKSIAP